MTYRVLAFPGGGIRGVLTAALLERLVAAHPSLLTSADLFAGTSTGGLLALGLAAGRTPAELRWLYERHGAAIFACPWWRRTGLFSPRFENAALKREVDRLLGGSRLGDFDKRVLISSFDLWSADKRLAAKFFHNYPEPGSGDRLQPAAWVAMATSAAPTYFPTWGAYVDGGVVANDPSMAAIAQVLDCRHGEQRPLDEIALLCIGTGEVAQCYPGGDHRWGLGQWAPKLVDVMFAGGQDVVSFQCRQLLGARYHRLQATLAKDVGLADVDGIAGLVEIARGLDIGPTVEWLQEHWRAPLPGARVESAQTSSHAEQESAA